MMTGYHCSIVDADELSTDVVDRMALLYLEYYDGTSRELFRHDLTNKDEVLLVFFGSELIGFTTLKVYGVDWRDCPIRVVYSGDTIVSAAHWGQQKLAFSWISRMGEIKCRAPRVPLYWFLLVKGHRTFKYLSVFGKSFFPHWAMDRSDLKPLADRLATDMFGAAYSAESGIVRFAESRGHLKREFAHPTPEELAKLGTQYFLGRNPGYLCGDELVCVCELELSNMKPLAARIFRRAMESAG
jgi:hypothetical protein